MDLPRTRPRGDSLCADEMVELSRDQGTKIAPWFGRSKDVSVLVDREWKLVRAASLPILLGTADFLLSAGAERPAFDPQRHFAHTAVCSSVPVGE